MNPPGIDANESVAHRSSGALPLNYLQRYGLAVVSIGVALGISLLLQHFGFRVPSALLLLFAVAISSWYAGAGPAVLAAILSTISFYWYFVEPVRTIYIYRSQIPYFVIFAAFAALLSRFGTFRQRAEADLRRTHDQLKVERPKLGSRTIALLYFAFSSCWILFTDRLVHGLGLSNAYLLKVSEAKGILFISLSTLLMYVLVEKALRQRHSVATAYWQLVETAQEGVWSVDAEGKTVFANENMAAILGTSPGEMIGKSILPFVPQEKKDELLNHLLQREQGLQEHYEFPFLRADGAQVWTLLRLSPVLRDGQHSGCLALVSDITKRKRAEETLRRLNRELCAISNCNQALLRATDEQSLLEEICRIVCEEAGYRMAWVSYAEHDEAKSVRPVAWTGAEEGYLASAGITWADTDRGRSPTGTAIRSGKSCCIQDFAKDPRLAPWREGLLQRGFRSGIALPLKDENDNAFGSLTIHSAQPNAFTSEEVRLLEELAGDLAFGIVTLRSEAARKRAEQEVTLLSFALDRVREAALLVDDTGRFRYVNEDGCRVLGYTREELLGMGVPDIDLEFPAGRWSDHWRDLKSHRSLNFESRHRTRDGRIFPVEISANYFEYAGQAYNLALARDITERKRADEELRESETRFRTFVDHAGDAFFVYDLEQRTVVDVNRSACESLGYTRQELIGKTPLGFHLDSDRAEIEAATERAAAGETVVERHWHRRKDGSLFPVEAHTSLVSYGGRRFLLKVARDISDRVRAEKAIRETEKQLRDVIDTIPALVWSTLPDGSVDFINRRTVEFTGLSFERASGEGWQSLIHPEDRDDYLAVRDAAMTSAQAFELEARIRRADGEYRWMLFRSVPLRDETGTVVKRYGVSTDIDDRRRAQQALRRSEAYLADAQRLAHTGSWAWDPATRRTLFWSEEMFKIFGVDPQEGGPDAEVFWQRIHPDDFDRTYEVLMKAAGENVDYEHEHRIVLPDGTIKHIHAIGHPVLDESGRVIEYVGTAVDITERKRAEEALRRAEGYLVEAQRLTHTGAWATDAEPQPLYWSQELFRLYGLDPQQGFPTHEQAVQRVHPEDRDRYVQTFHRVIHQKVDSDVEFRTVLPDGTIRYLYGLGHPILNANGDVIEVVGTTVDITERKRAEEERTRLRQLEADLAHINRVSMMGELAASIAHEVNQPLSGVVSNASACLRWLAGDAPNMEEAREATRRIVRDGKRAGEVIARIRALTKKAATPRERLHLNETIREVLALVGDQAKRNSVMIRTRFADDVAPVSGDQVQLQQVVLNLIMNGIEAMSSVGERARELVITTRNLDSEQVQVTVEDSGVGLDPNTITKIFDAFYTTKPGGMGMGLSISRSILQAHGGRLWATAKDGPGTVFHFTLPKYQEEESNARVAAV